MSFLGQTQLCDNKQIKTMTHSHDTHLLQVQAKMIPVRLYRLAKNDTVTSNPVTSLGFDPYEMLYNW